MDFVLKKNWCYSFCIKWWWSKWCFRIWCGGGGGASSIHTPQYRLIIAGGGGGGGHASDNTHSLPSGGGYGGGETGGRSPAMALPTLHGHGGQQTTLV